MTKSSENRVKQISMKYILYEDMKRQAKLAKEANEELMKQNSARQKENTELKHKLLVKDNIVEIKKSDEELKGRKTKAMTKKSKTYFHVHFCLFCDFKHKSYQL